MNLQLKLIEAYQKRKINALYEIFKTDKSKTTQDNLESFINALRELKRLGRKKHIKLFSDTSLTAEYLLDMDIPPRKNIVGGWLTAGNIGFIFGQRGKGKTFFSLSLACALAGGVSIHNWKISETFKVCYLDGEMSLSEIKERIKLFSESKIFNSNKDSLKKNLSFQHYEHISFLDEDTNLNLSEKEQQIALLDYCIKAKINVLFLDNISCLFGGLRENEADDWKEKVAPFLLEFRKKKISVISIAHAGRQGDNMRGTSSREDLADWIIQIKDNDDAETDICLDTKQVNAIVRFTKNRTGTTRETEDFSFQCKTIKNEMAIAFKTSNIEETIINYIENGINRNKDLSEATGKSKYVISRITTKLIKSGEIIKMANETFVSHRSVYGN